MGIFSFFKRKSKPPKAAKKQKVAYNAGLALSGGGTRGIAHIGAIRAFEEHGIVFSCVAGTSAGSLVGSLYAAGYNSYEIEEFARTIREREIINSRLFFVPSRSSNLENVMRRFLGDITFRELKLPFRAVCVDVITGEEVVLDEGSVAKAVSASSAVPGVFTPVEWHPYRLIDGGLQNTIPSDVVRSMGADKVIAIDINKARGTGTSSTKVVELLKATFRIAMKSTALKGDLHSDIIVAPDLTKFKSTKIDGFDQMLEIGYNATLEKMDEIKEILGIKGKPFTEPRTLPLAEMVAADTPDETAEPYTKEWFDQLEPITIEPEVMDKKALKKAEKEAKAAKKKEKK